MSSSFVLRLDTTAPAVAFGEPTGTTAGELLRIPYVADEPLERARLRLPDGRYVAMGVAGDVLEVLLPPDTNEGWAGIEVRDEVWNERLYAAVVRLQGIPLAPPPDRVGGLPRPARRRVRAPEPRRVVSRRAVYDLRSSASSAMYGRRYVGIPVLRKVLDLQAQLESVRVPAVTRISVARVDTRRSTSVAVARESVGVRRRDDEALLVLLEIPVVD